MTDQPLTPKGPPLKIWLQWHGDEKDPEGLPDPHYMNVSWSDQKVFDGDIEYVRIFKTTKEEVAAKQLDIVENPNPLEAITGILHDPKVSDEEFARQVEEFSKGQKPSIFVPTLSEDGKRIVSYTVTPGEGIPPGTKCGLGVTFGENSEMPTDTVEGEE